MQLHVRMSSRDPEEAHRASTPLELFFDLTFVVAIAEAGASLHHGLVDGRAGDALLGYPLVFFGIWWAWMNFTWFASAYDTDDAAYRIAVLVQMVGVLILAVGVPRALDHGQFAVMTWGYVVMRLALVAQWLRAAAADAERRSVALRYAAGITVAQVGWVARLALSRDLGLAAFFVLVAVELAVPVWAEAAVRTTWHPRHIAERYGLFTIIVLGEALSAAAFAVQAALDAHAGFGRLATTAVGGALIVLSMWWFYFDMPAEEIVESVRHAFADRLNGAFVWGYGHYLVFLSAAAVGAGLAVAVDQVTHHSELSQFQAGLALTVPAAAYLLTVWALHVRYKPPSLLRNYAVPVTAAMILASSATPQPALITGGLLAALVAISVLVGPPVVADREECRRGQHDPS
jgi:low temperature requirement protein LtrA